MHYNLRPSGNEPGICSTQSGLRPVGRTTESLPSSSSEKPTDWGGNPADLYREKKFLDQLTKCLAGLSPNHANAFTLREIEGADTGEICKVLNVTETNLWVILHRARMQLRGCLVGTEETAAGTLGEPLSEGAKERIRRSLLSP